jgi:SRSO17 transposase
LPGLVGPEPVVGAQAPSVQRRQGFRSESPWDAEAVTRRRLELPVTDPATAPHAGGVPVVDANGDRQADPTTAHVARQGPGSLGQRDGGIVAVTSRGADARGYQP